MKLLQTIFSCCFSEKNICIIHKKLVLDLFSDSVVRCKEKPQYSAVSGNPSASSPSNKATTQTNSCANFEPETPLQSLVLGFSGNDDTVDLITAEFTKVDVFLITF